MDAFCFVLYRHYNRLRALLKDPRHDCVLFANEFQQYSYCPRDKGESQDKWNTRWVLTIQYYTFFNALCTLRKEY